MDKKEIRRAMVEAINDSHTKDPAGVDKFVDKMMEAGAAEVNSYKLAWTKLTELLVILDKGPEDFSLRVGDYIKIMQYLLTSSVCIKDSTSVR